MPNVVCKFCGHDIQFEVGDRIKQCKSCGYCVLFSIEGEVTAWGDDTLITGSSSVTGTTGSTKSGGTTVYYGQSRKKKKIQKQSSKAQKILGKPYVSNQKHPYRRANNSY